MTDLLYRKKPVVIEAMQFQPVGSSGEDAARVESWCGGEMVVDDQGYCLVIKTLEGRMRASPGDWIIRGVAGEFYPCKPDIFEKTYEPATLPAVQPDAAAIREAALEDAIDHARQALVDAAYAYGDLQCKKSSAMFMAETHVYIAIRALINKPAAHHVNETPKNKHEAWDMLTPASKGGDA